MINFTRYDVDILRRLFKQQMDIASMPGRTGADAAVSVATQIDDLADRVEQELDPTTQEA